LSVDEEVELPNPNGLDGLSELIAPNELLPKRLLVGAGSWDLDTELLPKKFGAGLALPNIEVADGPLPNSGVCLVAGVRSDVDDESKANADSSSGFLTSAAAEEPPIAKVGAGGPAVDEPVIVDEEGNVKLKFLLGALEASNVGVNPPLEAVSFEEDGDVAGNGLRNPSKLGGGVGINGSGTEGLGGA
jgi:hypothetical protein